MNKVEAELKEKVDDLRNFMEENGLKGVMFAIEPNAEIQEDFTIGTEEEFLATMSTLIHFKGIELGKSDKALIAEMLTPLIDEEFLEGLK